MFFSFISKNTWLMEDLAPTTL